MSASTPPRGTYWTGWLSPEMEGCSKEVFQLKEHFRRSRVFGLSRHYEFKFSPYQRYYGINIRWYAFFRLLAPLIELRSDFNHIYGSMAEWVFLRTLRRRPIVLTVATSGEPLERSLYNHVGWFVAHTRRTVDQLTQWGWDPGRIRIIYPGVNLERFYPMTRDPQRKFRVLFATAPDDSRGFVERGVPLLLGAARCMPDVEFHLIWRPWGNTRAMAEHAIAEMGISNVTLYCGLVSDMAEVFREADVTVAPFLAGGDVKLCPTSLIESLSCGRPILVSEHVGIAGLAREEACGEVFDPNVEALCAAIERARSRYDIHSKNARACAERHFDLQRVLRKYEQLYQEVLAVNA